MPKTARTEIVPVRFTPEEHRRIQRVAARTNSSMSEFVRSATLIYTEIRSSPKYNQKFFAPILGELAKSGDLKRLDLTREDESHQ